MQQPNLFKFATSELSQDAFICWLASWADPSLKVKNEALHATATAFLDLLLKVGKVPIPSEYRSIEVRQQWHNIDVLLLLNCDTAIIIEDKTNTEDAADKLERYKKTVAEEFPNYRVAAVYLKTGDQCDYGSAEQAGYGCFLRPDFLELLKKGTALGVTNEIFADFHRHLQGIERAVQSFSVVPLEAWGGEQWRGFFMAQRQALGEGNWFHFGHSGGGTWTFRWHWRGDKFLRLAKKELAFKVEVADELQREAKWLEWNNMLLAKNGIAGIHITTPRMKLGKRMTVAALKGDYRQQDVAGRLDLDRTVETLKKAEKLMDAALGAS